MHVGMSLVFNNPDNAFDDAELWGNELRLADMAEPLGFESLWVTEHHFTEYTMMPDALQFLSYMAGRTRTIGLGTMVVVLPWHDPVRLAEQIVELDHLSGGRTILGIGRGIADIEFEGLRIPMDESRGRFVETAQIVMAALESGVIECDGTFFQQPRRELRPRPLKSFRGRVYSAAISPESRDIVASLGCGMLVTAQKPWDVLAKDLDAYRERYLELHGSVAPPPSVHIPTFVDVDGDRARELGSKYMKALYGTTIKHYNLNGSHFANIAGYDYYAKMSDHLNAYGDKALDFFVDLQVLGTPEECLDKIEFIQSVVGNDKYVFQPSFGGMSLQESQRNIRCFAAEVLPQLRQPRFGAVLVS